MSIVRRTATSLPTSNLELNYEDELSGSSLSLSLPEDLEQYELSVQVVQCSKRYTHDWTVCPVSPAVTLAKSRLPHSERLSS